MLSEGSFHIQAVRGRQASPERLLTQPGFLSYQVRAVVYLVGQKTRTGVTSPALRDISILCEFVCEFFKDLLYAGIYQYM